MARVPIEIVDAFAERPFTGNPAAIVPDAAGLSERLMLQVADELRMEAGFVLPPASAAADLRLRFFTPRREAMLSGHVLVAALVCLAERGRLPAGPQPAPLTVETGRGLLAASVARAAGGPVQVSFDLPLPRFGEPVPSEEVAAALGLAPAALRLGDHRPQRVSCGFDVLVVPIVDRTAARGTVTAMEPVRRLADRLGVGGLACFSPETSAPGVDLFCRFFHPSEGMDEDVASGTSLGAVAAYCLEQGVLPRAPQVRVVTEQGHLLGRPTRAIVEAELAGRRIARIGLTAAGAVVMRGEFGIEARASGAHG